MPEREVESVSTYTIHNSKAQPTVDVARHVDPKAVEGDEEIHEQYGDRLAWLVICASVVGVQGSHLKAWNNQLMTTDGIVLYSSAPRTMIRHTMQPL